ncbi:hypothetical protein [Rubritalea tangerina]|uniref:hypothetical protein n=1 Tax=Rubritalea tangerina TaxID=430798 RepID=UPI003616640E
MGVPSSWNSALTLIIYHSFLARVVRELLDGLCACREGFHLADGHSVEFDEALTGGQSLCSFDRQPNTPSKHQHPAIPFHILALTYVNSPPPQTNTSPSPFSVHTLLSTNTNPR